MSRIFLKLLAAAAVAHGFAVPAQATQLTFEDVSGGSLTALGSSHAGFSWDNAYAVEASAFSSNQGDLTFISFDREFPGGVDKVRFNNYPNALVFDDLTVNGENVPASATLALLGLSGFAALRRKSGENTNALKRNGLSKARVVQASHSARQIPACIDGCKKSG